MQVLNHHRNGLVHFSFHCWFDVLLDRVIERIMFILDPFQSLRNLKPQENLS